MTWQVDPAADRFYFFNPFSIEIFRKAMERILESYYENPRNIILFLYYPSTEYITYLMSLDELTLIDAVDCSDMFQGKKEREIILVYELFHME